MGNLIEVILLAIFVILIAIGVISIGFRKEKY